MTSFEAVRREEPREPEPRFTREDAENYIAVQNLAEETERSRAFVVRIVETVLTVVFLTILLGSMAYAVWG